MDIGDVDVKSIIPGTGATNLGKAIDTAVGSTDTGVLALAKHKEDLVHLTTADGDTDVPTLDSLGQLHVNPEGHHVFDAMNAVGDWLILNDATANFTTTKKHVIGTNALIFDKVDGTDNFAAVIDQIITSVDLGDISLHDIIQTVSYIPDLADVAYVFVRLGTDDTNYNEWRIPDTALTAAEFEILAFNIGDASNAGITGNGWDPSAITYIAVGVQFDGEDDALVGIIFDSLSYHTNTHTSAELNAEVSSSVSSANVNLQKVGGSPTDKNSGNKSNGSQRVVLATDDINAALIKTAAELIDNPIVAHDAAASGSSGVMMAGGVAQDVDDTAPPNRISTEADALRLAADFDGALFVRTHGPQLWSYHVDGSSALTDAAVHADPGAGLSIYVTDIAVSSGAATAMNVFFEEGGTKVLGPWYLEAIAGRGLHIRFSTPKKITANTALTVTTSAAIAHSIDATGFIGQG